MAKSTPKFYVIWVGAQTGVFSNWETCKTYINGIQGAKYKSFASRAEAEQAYAKGHEHYIGLANKTPASNSTSGLISRSKIIQDSISVDGAWNTVTGDCEYQGVYTGTGEQLFIQGVFKDGTNNVVEFLGLVHGLAFLQKQASNIPIYSDSRTAISWVRQKKCKTQLEKTPRNAQLFELIARAETWLENNHWENQILKWETESWGENPADFGRK
jgi:ribonuclease HI